MVHRDHHDVVDRYGVGHHFERWTLSCDGCQAIAPVGVSGAHPWPQAQLHHQAAAHGFTQRLDGRVLRDYCAACTVSSTPGGRREGDHHESVHDPRA
jgi:hypothetical protein